MFNDVPDKLQRRPVVRIFELPEPEKLLYSSFSSQSARQQEPDLVKNIEVCHFYSLNFSI